MKLAEIYPSPRSTLAPLCMHTYVHTQTYTHIGMHMHTDSLLVDGSCDSYEASVSHSTCSSEVRHIVTQGAEKLKQEADQTQRAPF